MEFATRPLAPIHAMGSTPPPYAYGNHRIPNTPKSPLPPQQPGNVRISTPQPQKPNPPPTPIDPTPQPC